MLTRVTRVRRPVLQQLGALPAAVVHHHHTDAAPAAVIRTVAPTAVPVATAHSSHSSTTVHTHEPLAPVAGIRTVSHPVVHAVAHAEPVAHHVEHVQEVRTVPLPAASAVSHSHSSITHETPAHTLVRTAAAPVVPVAVHGTAPVTVHHAPLVHHTPLVHNVPDPVVAAPAIVRAVVEEPAAVARYNYGYSVNDAVSGDSKQRQESREGDVVTGSYTVADPDGRIRHVEYVADKLGFRATVTYDGEPGPAAIPFAAPVQATTVAASPALVPQAAAAVIAARNELPALPVLPAPAHVVQPLQPATTVVRNFAQPAATTHLVHAPVGVAASRLVQTPFATVPNFVNGFPFGASAVPVRQVFPVTNANEANENGDDDVNVAA